MTVVNFAPLTGLAGGLRVGAGASLLLWLNGRIAGISGIFSDALAQPGAGPYSSDTPLQSACWRNDFAAPTFSTGYASP